MLWLENARGPSAAARTGAAATYDQLYPCVKYEMHVQINIRGGGAVNRSLGNYQKVVFEMIS